MRYLNHSLLASAALSAALLPACAAQEASRLQAMAETIHAQLDGEVVGYAFVIQDLNTGERLDGARGLARLSGDGGPMEMTPDRRMIIASVSKWVTTLGTLSVLEDQGLTPDEPIGAYLPSEWRVDPYLRTVTFGQLLAQTAGIKDFGNGLKDYALLEAFFSQEINPDAETGCDGPWAETPQFGITPGDLSYCYSNYNWGLLQLLLPRLAGYPEDADLTTRPHTLARQFEGLIQSHVFEPLGVTEATCAPADSDYALSYIFPGESPGKDWGEQYDRCATGGWYVSPRALAAITASAAIGDGRILEGGEAALAAIRDHGFGLDRNTPRMMEKSGVLGDDPGVLATSAMIRLDADAAPHLVAVLYVNSTNSQVRIAHARPVLEQSYAEAFEEAAASD